MGSESATLLRYIRNCSFSPFPYGRLRTPAIVSAGLAFTLRSLLVFTAQIRKRLSRAPSTNLLRVRVN